MLKAKRDLMIRGLYRMYKKQKDFFGFNKAINWNKLKDPKVLKELEKIFEEKKTNKRASKPTSEQASEQKG